MSPPSPFNGLPSSAGPKADPNAPLRWLESQGHRAFLATQAQELLRVFRASLNPRGGFFVLDPQNRPLPQTLQELHTTTRLVHSYAIGKLAGAEDCDAIIDQGMAHLWQGHRDPRHGGYVWSTEGTQIKDGVKLAYGHVFVLLAASSAKQVGHPDADRLLADVSTVLEQRFWDDDAGLFADEFNRDWTPFSTYRGMNANMHGVEALLAAYEATREALYLRRAGRILDHFLGQVAPAHALRLPEHYDASWQVDAGYEGNPMFRPAGTTPGHSFEMARLALQHWDLAGRPKDKAPGQTPDQTPDRARSLAYRALLDAWDDANGGFVYTVDVSGAVLRPDRYWWPVTEAIGVLAALLKLDPQPEDEVWYRRVWAFAETHFIDHAHGGWFPEIDATGAPDQRQFAGKPDIYHALQAVLFPLVPGLSDYARAAQAARPLATH